MGQWVTVVRGLGSGRLGFESLLCLETLLGFLEPVRFCLFERACRRINVGSKV